MVYAKIDTLIDKLPKRIKELQEISYDLIPQIGLTFVSKTKGNQCKEIILGQYDKEINFLINYLKEIKTPVFIRLGYEFNEPGKYNAEDFILTWKYLVDLFKKNKVTNVAFVWCACTAFSRDLSQIMSYYPGDNYVDWFGNDLFSARHFKNNSDALTEEFAKEAETHKKPLMIGESSAARTGVEKGEESWQEWFNPYFKWINTHNVVKAFCYINWDWAKDWKQPEWGNCRIEENEVISKKYAEEMKNKRYLHYQKMEELLEKLYY